MGFYVVIGPDDSSTIGGEFKDKMPPSFNGRDEYASYHEDVFMGQFS